MHPAPSVIIFSVLSGAGFGFLAFLGAGAIEPTGWAAFVCFLGAYALAVGGLLASTLHLGHPERALKAFSQWRTSWLSREAWAAVATLLIMGVYALGAIFFGQHMRVVGWIGAAGALATVTTTAMIYTQLKTVPRWSQWPTPVMFLVFALAGGAILALQFKTALALLLVLAVVLGLHWTLGNRRLAELGTTTGTATGLGDRGQVRLLEPPHTGSNYLLREMVYVVGRKHLRKLRWIALAFAVALPAVILVAFPPTFSVAIAAVVSHLVGAFAARWIFFAEAEHVVSLYY